MDEPHSVILACQMDCHCWNPISEMVYALCFPRSKAVGHEKCWYFGRNEGPPPLLERLYLENAQEMVLGKPVGYRKSVTCMYMQACARSLSLCWADPTCSTNWPTWLHHKSNLSQCVLQPVAQHWPCQWWYRGTQLNCCKLSQWLSI